MRRLRCIIDKCNSYILYKHLGLCKKHYNKLLGLGWKNPSEYMDCGSAKKVLEENHTFKKAKSEYNMEVI